MANAEHLYYIKQGPEIFNNWRSHNQETSFSYDNQGKNRIYPIDLENADLRDLDLKNVDLRSALLWNCKLNRSSLETANLKGSDFWKANLSYSNLKWATLEASLFIKSILIGATLNSTVLTRANFWGSNLSFAKLHNSRLIGTNLSEVILHKTEFTNAFITGVNFSGAILNGTVFNMAKMQDCIFVNNDLSKCIGLESIQHRGPSSIGIGTLQQSKGKICTSFLRGCGLSDLDIEYAKLYNQELRNEEITEILYKMHDLRANRAIQISSLFISYSHKDSCFVDRLEKELQKNGIRYWRDIHNMKAGRLESQVDRAIRHNPIVLLILSENSIKSDWVEYEVRLSRKLEKETNRDSLCPISLDDNWKRSNWPERIMEQIMEYSILDFSNWNNEDEFLKMYRNLIEGLDLYYN